MPAGEFEDLELYKEARRLRQRVSRLVRLLPGEERFVLVAQMKRAALSVTNNIAEGHGSRSYRHNISYLYRSRGSVNELLDDINACQDEGYFNPEHLDNLREQVRTVVRLINGYSAFLRRRLAQEQTSRTGRDGAGLPTPDQPINR